MATFLDGKAISGLPGTFFQCNLYPFTPLFHIAFLIASSGFVFLSLIELINREVISLSGIGALPSRVYFFCLIIFVTNLILSVWLYALQLLYMFPFMAFIFRISLLEWFNSSFCSSYCATLYIIKSI
jgi:hypothetical protein